MQLPQRRQINFSPDPPEVFQWDVLEEGAGAAVGSLDVVPDAAAAQECCGCEEAELEEWELPETLERVLAAIDARLAECSEGAPEGAGAAVGSNTTIAAVAVAQGSSAQEEAELEEWELPETLERLLATVDARLAGGVEREPAPHDPAADAATPARGRPAAADDGGSRGTHAGGATDAAMHPVQPHLGGQERQARCRAAATKAAALPKRTSSSCMAAATATPKAAASVATAPAPSGSSTSPPHRYHGIVKYFRGSFGWITCATVSAKFHGLDVFLHKRDCDAAPKLGDRVSFALTVDERGNPKAAEARVEPPASSVAVSARDWFAQRQASQRP